MNLSQRFVLHKIGIGIVAAGLLAGFAAPDAQVRDIDTQADASLKKMCSVLDGARAFRLGVHATMDRAVGTGQLAQFHRVSDITIVRPDRLYANTISDEGQWSTWYRGKNLTVLDKDSNTYATETVPGRIDDMLDYLVDEYDLVIPMADLLIGKTYDSLVADVESGEYLGLHNVGDTPCHHLLFRQKNLDWQIWIDAEKQPLPRKLVITYTDESNQPQYVALMDEWDLSPNVSDNAFTFVPPDGSTSTSMSDLVAQTEEN